MLAGSDCTAREGGRLKRCFEIARGDDDVYCARHGNSRRCRSVFEIAVVQSRSAKKLCGADRITVECFKW